MPRKPNYNLEKRNKELRRQATQDAKREEKLRRKREAEADTVPTSDTSADDQ